MGIRGSSSIRLKGRKQGSLPVMPSNAATSFSAPLDFDSSGFTEWADGYLRSLTYGKLRYSGNRLAKDFAVMGIGAADVLKTGYTRQQHVNLFDFFDGFLADGKQQPTHVSKDMAIGSYRKQNMKLVVLHMEGRPEIILHLVDTDSKDSAFRLGAIEIRPDGRIKVHPKDTPAAVNFFLGLFRGIQQAIQ